MGGYGRLVAGVGGLHAAAMVLYLLQATRSTNGAPQIDVRLVCRYTGPQSGRQDAITTGRKGGDGGVSVVEGALLYGRRPQ
jgi:hypothetical protein